MGATQDMIDAYRDEVRAQFDGELFKIDSNGYELRVECMYCGSSCTRNPEMYMRNHKCKGRMK